MQVKQNKLLSLVLTLAMAFSLFTIMPLTASAADGTTTPDTCEVFNDSNVSQGTMSFDDAWNTVRGEIGWTVKLLHDIEFYGEIGNDYGKDIILDLNGKTLTIETGIWGSAITVRSGSLHVVGPGTLNAISTDPYSTGVHLYMGGELTKTANATINAVGATGVSAADSSKATVTNVTGGNTGVSTSSVGDELTVEGDITATKTGVHATKGTVIVNGNISVTGEYDIIGVEAVYGAIVYVKGAITSDGEYIAYWDWDTWDYVCLRETPYPSIVKNPNGVSGNWYNYFHSDSKYNNFVYVAAAGYYNADDIAVVNNIIDINGLGWTEYDEAAYASDPLDWTGVTWSEGPNARIVELDVKNEGLDGALNVTGLTALTALYCQNNNLTSLVLPTSLEILMCQYNDFESLDLTGCADLIRVHCYGNYMSTAGAEDPTLVTGADDITAFIAWGTGDFAFTAQRIRLTFTHSTSYDVPAGNINTAITAINVSGGVTGGEPDYVYSLSGPVWLVIDADTGIITGTRPGTVQAATTALVSVEDDNGTVKSINITVGAVSTPRGGGGGVKSYIVSFNSNGGSSLSSQTVVAGNKVTKPADPIKASYIFAGWFADSSLTSEYDFSKNVAADFTLYAKWNEPQPITPTMPDSPFSDVKETDWFIGDVIYAISIGLIDGKAPTIFAPNDYLTYAESVKLAACMHQLYTTGEVTLTNGSPWYQSYADYAKQNGIINGDFDWKAPATRMGYMEIFANALPAGAYAIINDIADGAIPDIPMTHPQATAVYKLYRAGIVQGVDAAHNCNPDSNIKRSEVAAILTTMMKDDARIEFSI